MTRRAMIAGGVASSVATLLGVRGFAQPSDAARDAIARATPIDLHSHAGHLTGVSRVRKGGPFAPVAGPMRQGGLAIACLAIVADSPCHKVIGGRIRPFRDPDPGELYAYSELGFGRLFDLVRQQRLSVVTDAASLRTATADNPSVIVSSEGGDFLEGQADRVDEAYHKYSMRHLQLTHYRVNELGDIQTEEPVHGGLTDAGADVIRRCNKLGVVVDVAHGTYDLVKRAASVTTKPLVLSHTSLSNAAGPFTRTITDDHARLIASTGGVIGVWPPDTIFRSLPAMARGMMRLADVVGVEHVGIGSDMEGLLSGSVFDDYSQLPQLTQALLDAGFSGDDVTRILGGNYVRVFEATLG